MKISYISNSSCPSQLPSSLQIVKTCEYLAKQQNQVTLIIPNTASIKQSLNKFYDIKFKFKVIILKKFKKFPIGISYYVFSFLSFMRARNISEVIISRNYFVIFLCSILKKKCIMELHGDITNESRIVKIIFKIFNVLNSKYVSKIVCISNSVKKKYIHDYYINKPNKLVVLPSGSSLKFNYRNNLNNKRLKIGYFGTINPSRGIKIILKLAQFNKDNDYYIFGGSKNQITELDILLMPYSNKVTVSGNVSNTTSYMSPLKLFDYMSTGRLILSSRLKVLEEVVNDKQCIFVQNYLNPISWLHEIKKIEKNILKRNIIGKNSYIKSKKYFHSERVLKYLN